jgi:hypothetical protein
MLQLEQMVGANETASAAAGAPQLAERAGAAAALELEMRLEKVRVALEARRWPVLLALALAPLPAAGELLLARDAGT